MTTDRDTTIRKYPKIRYPDEPESDGWNDGPTDLVFLEKLDGSNFRFKRYPYSEDKPLLFGSRNVLFHAHGEPNYEDNVGDMFRPVIQYVLDTIDIELLDEWEDELGELWIYGENMFEHSVNYDYEGKYPDPNEYTQIPNFLGFDVWMVEDNAWMPYTMMCEFFHAIGISVTEEVRTVAVEDITNEHKEIPESVYRIDDPGADNEFDRRGLAEGMVIRNDMTGVRTKVVHDEFQEKNAIDFESPGKARTEAGKFIASYVTKARIRKQAHKLIEEGEWEELEMPMMEELPEEVFRDVMEEHGWEIFSSNLDLSNEVRGEIRSRGSSKCARTLQDMIRGF